MTFADSIHELNSFVCGRCLRRYQSDILSTATLTLCSPFSSAPVSANRSTLLPGGAIAYEFVAEKQFWLLADDLAQGFPLSRIALKEEGSESAFAPISGLVRQKLTPELLNLLLEPDSLVAASPPKERGAALILGHPNFAHYLWNEMGGLDAWLTQTGGGAVESITIFAQYEPLGPIERLFGVLADAEIRRGAGMAEINRFPALLTRIGATVIPIPVRRRAVAALRTLSGEHAEAVLSRLEDASPVFWLSIRPAGNLRTCVNELPFLNALTSRLMTTYPKCAILLDGFSLPVDYHSSARYDDLRTTFQRRLESCGVVVRELCLLIEQHAGGARLGRVYDMCGLSLADAVTTAQRADYYVSHAGTLQHKLGWMHNTPGFVHSCQGGISPGARKWYAAQLEGGVEPEVIESAFVEDLQADAGGSVAARNLDYRITDIPGAVAQVLHDIRLHLPPVPADLCIVPAFVEFDRCQNPSPACGRGKGPAA